MNWIVRYLWLIPALPLFAAGLSSLAKQRQRKFPASLAIGSMGVALILSCVAFANALQHSGNGEVSRQVSNFRWFQFGDQWLELGWVLDPLAAVMLVMVSLVGLLIFIYSVGYMSHDENCTRFFCFLSLFAAAMLGVVIANNLLFLFICWELVGLTSYLLIGFWCHKPSAAAAAKKAFITTRIGDLAFLLGMIWLYSKTGTLLFYDAGNGCLEQSALAKLVTQTTSLSIAVAQNDIKRILAYSTVSQLGFMMMGLGVGGIAVGMFHLITHAFFKALLFLGAGSLIHGCHQEQDVRCMGGLRKFMPVTFATYAVGMLALCGFPLFSGFWSKDEILHAAHGWSISQAPFYLGLFGALLTAFYMTRQVSYVFFGNCRIALGRTTGSEQYTVEHAGVPAKEH